MIARSIDLNADVGEQTDADGVAVERALLGLVTSANIACGGHAGDRESMSRTVAEAIERDLALGAHPSYPDRANFGRVAVQLPAAVLEESIAEQLEALLQAISPQGGALAHVKPHGALYHAAMREVATAETVGRAVRRVGLQLALVGQAGAAGLEVWRGMGFPVAAEAFADRGYEARGMLRERGLAGALIDDPAEAAAQAVRIATGAGALTEAGESAAIAADTICVHGDSPHAVACARAVREALEHAGISVRRLGR